MATVQPSLLMLKLGTCSTYVDVYVDVGSVQDLDLAGNDLGHEKKAFQMQHHSLLCCGFCKRDVIT